MRGEKKKNHVYVSTARVRVGEKARDMCIHAWVYAKAVECVPVCVKKDMCVEEIRAKMRARVGKCV